MTDDPYIRWFDVPVSRKTGRWMSPPTFISYVHRDIWSSRKDNAAVLYRLLKLTFQDDVGNPVSDPETVAVRMILEEDNSTKRNA